jgi:hypothetical protein
MRAVVADGTAGRGAAKSSVIGTKIAGLIFLSFGSDFNVFVMLALSGDFGDGGAKSDAILTSES